MSNEKLGELVKSLSPDDIRLDSLGRVVITSQSVVDKIKAVGTLRPDELARDDTNVICCGNGTCSKKADVGDDLGTLMERFTGGRIK